MDQKVIEQLLQEHAGSTETVKAYKSVYNRMRDFEAQYDKDFADDPYQMTIDFIKAQGYTNIMALNNQLLYIKYYLEKLGKGCQVEQIKGQDFDLSYPMRQKFVESLNEVYQRNSLVFAPDNGDAIFPLSSFAWMGLTLSQAISLPASMVDLDNGKIIGMESQTTFHQMPIEMCEVLAKFKGACISHKGNGQTKIPDRTSAFIYKTSFAGSNSVGKKLSIGTATSFFTRVREEYNKTHVLQITTTYKDITTSARYYRIRAEEINGLDINDTANGKRLQEAFNTKRIEPGYIRYNYQMYKKAFGLK